MSLLKQATGIGGHSGEELKHEGVMDMFKSKNIKTTFRTLFYGLFLDDCEFLQKGVDYLEEYLMDENEKIIIHKEDVEEVVSLLKKFLSGSKNTLIIDKSLSNIDKSEYGTHIYQSIKEELNKKKPFNYEYSCNIVKKVLEDPRMKGNSINKLLEEYITLFPKVTTELIKDNSFTTEKITENPSLPKICPESALNSINQDWLATKNEIQLLSETASTFTTESATNFISNIKTFFTNSLMGINNALSNFMKTYTITDKYFKDNVNMLNSKSSAINSIISKKFFEIENIETKCVVGMKLNYLGTTKELKIFASKIPEIKTSIDGVSNFIENLYNNHNDARLSNIKNLDNLTELSSKTTEIISELIDGKSIKENVTIGNLFPNSNGIKIVKDELIEVNNILYKADVEALNKSVNRLISVVTIFLKEINENEAMYSKGVINSLQYSVKETADIITNFGTFLVLSNQFTSYYLTTIDVIKDNAK